jgi:hypothetical protein
MLKELVFLNTNTLHQTEHFAYVACCLTYRGKKGGRGREGAVSEGSRGLCCVP